MNIAIVTTDSGPARTVNALAGAIGGGASLFLLGAQPLVREGHIEGLAPFEAICHLDGGALAQRFDFAPHCEALIDAGLGEGYDLILLHADEDGNRLAPLLAARLECPCLLDVTGLDLSDDAATAVKSVYGMNLKARYPLKGLAVLTLAGAQADGGTSGPQPARRLPVTAPSPTWFEGLEVTPDTAEDDIRDAQNVLAAGRGLSGTAGLARLNALAGLMDAKIGYTRPLVQENGMPQGSMLGASGVLIAPKFCMVFGASGTAPFAAGVEKSGVLVGVNHDPEAPLFAFCDYGLVDDCEGVAESMIEHLGGPAAGEGGRAGC